MDGFKELFDDIKHNGEQAQFGTFYKACTYSGSNVSVIFTVSPVRDDVTWIAFEYTDLVHDPPLAIGVYNATEQMLFIGYYEVDMKIETLEAAVHYIMDVFKVKVKVKE